MRQADRGEESVGVKTLSRQLVVDLGIWIGSAITSFALGFGMLLNLGAFPSTRLNGRAKSAQIVLKDGSIMKTYSPEEYERALGAHRGEIASMKIDMGDSSPGRRVLPFTLLLFFLQLFCYTVYRERTKLRFACDLSSILLGLLGAGVVLALEWVCDHALDWLGIAPGSNLQEQLRKSTGVLALVFVGVIAAPIVEESYFRGRLHDLLEDRFGLVWAIAATAVLFAGAHGSITNSVLYVLMAVVFSTLRILTKNLVAPILAHAVVNLTVLFVLTGT